MAILGQCSVADHTHAHHTHEVLGSHGVLATQVAQVTKGEFGRHITHK